MLIAIQRNVSIISLFFIIFIELTVNASNLDTLKIKLQKAKEDTNKVLVLLEISGEKGVIDGYESIRYSKEALELSAKLNYKTGKIKSCSTLGEEYTKKAEYETAFKYLNDAELDDCSPDDVAYMP